MGRWVIEDAGSHEKIVVLDDKLFAGGPERYMMDAHNADCDAYEKRIAELEAEQGRLRQIILDDGMELARVKAESLRVVVVGDELIEDADTWRCLDNVLGLYCREKDLILIEGDEASHVRLERWETEE